MAGLFPVIGAMLVLTTAPYEELRRLYDYDARAALEVKEAGVEHRDGIAVHDLSFASSKGGRVTAYLAIPSGQGPFPAILFMHGAGPTTKGRSVAMPFVKAGFATMSIDGPFSGARAVPGGRMFDPDKPERSRDSLIQTVVDLRRALDVLVSRPEVDAGRLGFVGGSYGALTGGVLAGVEKRIKAYVLASGLPSIMEARIESVKKIQRNLAKEEIERLFDSVAAIHYVSHAAPAAILFQNGRQDEGITADVARRWHEAGSEPKLIKWYDGGHGLTPAAGVDRLEWLKQQLGVRPLNQSNGDGLSPWRCRSSTR